MKRVKRIMGLLVMTVVIVMLSMATTACYLLDGGTDKEYQKAVQREEARKQELKKQCMEPINIAELKTFRNSEIEKIALKTANATFTKHKDPKVRFTPEKVLLIFSSDWQIYRDNFNRPTKREKEVILISKENGKWVGRDGFFLTNKAADFGGKWSEDYNYYYNSFSGFDPATCKGYPRELLNYNP